MGMQIHLLSILLAIPEVPAELSPQCQSQNLVLPPSCLAVLISSFLLTGITLLQTLTPF